MTAFYKIRGKKLLYLLLDNIIFNSIYLLSFFVRFYPNLNQGIGYLNYKYFIFLSISYTISFYLNHAYRIMWTYSNVRDVYKMIVANIIGGMCFLTFIIYFRLGYSRSIILLACSLIAGTTIFYRVLLRDYFSRIRAKLANNSISYEGTNSKKIIIGAGEAGRLILAEYYKKGFSKEIIGFLDDNPNKYGRVLNGKSVIGNTADIKKIIKKYMVNEVVIAMPSASSENISRIVSSIKKISPDLSIKILPSVFEMIGNKNLISNLREVGITDIIGREEFRINTQLIKSKFKNKIILVTGAGGSIGSEICKQLLQFNVKKIIALGRGEASIYNLAKELNQKKDLVMSNIQIIYKICDIKDYSLLKLIFENYSPDIVFHAAAHKHVPLMESNEIEAVQNNVGGSNNVLKLSAEYNVDEFILISSDKAVNPLNIMGATKRVSELLAAYYNKTYNLKSIVVRFGNVLGSRGSVIPLFLDQIKNNGPITITHPDIKRFFMSIPEASLLVINAAAYAKGGETFVLNMGKQYKILDIAKKIIQLHGLRPEKDIKIEFTGLRPGEKLYEELFYNKNDLISTDNEKIYVLKDHAYDFNHEDIQLLLNYDLYNLIKCNSVKIRELIKKIVPEYDYSNYDQYCNELNRMVY